MYFLGVCLAIAYGMKEYMYSFTLVCALILVILIGAVLEGLRFYQYIFIIAFVFQIVLVVMDIFSYIALAVYCILLILPIIGILIFGEGNLDRLEMTGPFEVGHKDMHLSDGAAVSIFYPMDKEEYNNQIYKSSK